MFNAILKGLVFVTLWLFALSPRLFASDLGEVRGAVFDRQTNAPLAGASVFLVPKTDAFADEILYAYGRNRVSLADLSGEMANERRRAGAVVQKDGSFLIKNVKAGEYALTVRYTGYKKFTQDLTLKQGESLRLPDTRLNVDAQGLEEIVVTGLASRRSKDRAEVAVSRVDAAEYMEKRGMQYADVTQLLMGKVAGVQVVPSSGNVGAGVRFNVRSGGGLSGYGRPVVYIDGVRMLFTAFGDYAADYGDDLLEPGFGSVHAGGQGVSSLLSVAPQDIERVEVLKGPAAAALYGTQASNGAILITTKRGLSSGETGLRLSVVSTQGWNEQSRPYTKDMLLSYQDVNSVFRIGRIAEYGVQAEAATSWARAYFSVGSRSEEGIIAKSQAVRTSLRGTVEISPFTGLSLSFSASRDYSIGQRPNNGFINTFENIRAREFETPGFLQSAMIFGPDSLGASRAFQAPLISRQIWEAYGIEFTHGQTTLAADALWDILPGLTLRAAAGMQKIERNDLVKRFLPYFPTRRESNFSVLSFNIDASLSYAYTLGEEFSAQTTVGLQTYDRADSVYERFISDQLQNYAGRFEGFREAGIFAQQEFSYRAMYFLSAGARQDYASTLLNPRGEATSVVYPFASAAARVDKIFPDMRSNGWTLFKLRGGYGESGILPRPALRAESIWQRFPYTSFRNGIIDRTPAYFMQRRGNPDLQAERVREFEFGVELEWANRYGAEITWYRQFCDNSIITEPPAPPSDHVRQFLRAFINGGAIESSGVEALLYAHPLQTTHESLTLRAIVNVMTNRITALPGVAAIPARFFARRPDSPYQPFNAVSLDNREGFARETYFSRTFLGAFFDADGRYAGPLYDTLCSFARPGVPPVSASFSASFRFLDVFLVSVLVEGAFGHVIPNFMKTFLYDARFQNHERVRTLAAQLGLDRERGYPTFAGIAPLPPGSPEYRAAAEEFARYDITAFDGNIALSSSFFEPADFVRLREVGISYAFADATFSLFGGVVRSASLSLSLRNAALWTPYSFPDPEVAADGSLARARSDRATLQNPRTICFALRLAF
jgi:TonB-dependent SusC/RagA subfamily outer membrane receptor